MSALEMCEGERMRQMRGILQLTKFTYKLENDRMRGIQKIYILPEMGRDD